MDGTESDGFIEEHDGDHVFQQMSGISRLLTVLASSVAMRTNDLADFVGGEGARAEDPARASSEPEWRADGPFLMLVRVISKRSPSLSTSAEGSALMAPFSRGARASKKLSEPEKNVSTARSSRADQGSSEDCASGRFPGKEERLFPWFGVARPSADAGSLLRGVIEQQRIFSVLRPAAHPAAAPAPNDGNGAVGAAVSQCLIGGAAHAHGDACADVVARVTARRKCAPVMANCRPAANAAGTAETPDVSAKAHGVAVSSECASNAFAKAASIGPAQSSR